MSTKSQIFNFTALAKFEQDDIISRIIAELAQISPLFTALLGQAEPGANYKRDGKLSYSDGSNWVVSTTASFALYSGEFTTIGGDANEAISVTGVVPADRPIVLVKTRGAVPRVVESASAGTNVINVVMSGDPSTDHVLNYFVFRAAGKGLYRYDTTGSGSWIYVG